MEDLILEDRSVQDDWGDIVGRWLMDPQRNVEVELPGGAGQGCVDQFVRSRGQGRCEDEADAAAAAAARLHESCGR